MPTSRLKKKVVDYLPKDLKKPLEKAPLKDITFSDLNTIGRQLNTLRSRDSHKFDKDIPTLGCAKCWCWP
jgi:hypothetical protein